MFKHLLVFLCLIVIGSSVQTCRQFLMKTMFGMRFNREETLKKLQHFMFLSGKSLNDFGFPDICAKQQNATYTTIQLTTQKNGYPYTNYLGLCFHNSCPASELNINYKLILSVLRNYASLPIPDPITFNAVVPVLKQQKYSVQVFCCFILIIILICTQLFHSAKNWCKQQSEIILPQYVSTQTNLQYQNHSFSERISFQHKFNKLVDKPQEQTQKISFISIFRVLSIPVIILGQQSFYRTNASTNAHSFRQSLFYSLAYRVALISLYLPDIMFFFSGYIFCSKSLRSQSQIGVHLKMLLKKILRLYPLYLLALLYFWIINPAINTGPVWHIYQQQAGLCDTNWWRSLLMIDNLFQNNNCFKHSWFVQAQIQFTIVSSILCYLYKKHPKIITIITSIIVTLGIIFNMRQNMVVPLFETMNTDTNFKQHFISSLSHFHYYIFGVLVMFCKSAFQSLTKQMFFNFLKPITTVAGMIILILISTSSQGSNYTQSQLLSFVGFLILSIPFLMQQQSKNKNPFHKIAYFTFPIILVSTIITYTAVWSRFSFIYLSTSTLGNLMITQVILGGIIGIITGVMLYPFRL